MYSCMYFSLIKTLMPHWGVSMGGVHEEKAANHRRTSCNKHIPSDVTATSRSDALFPPELLLRWGVWVRVGVCPGCCWRCWASSAPACWPSCPRGSCLKPRWASKSCTDLFSVTASPSTETFCSCTTTDTSRMGPCSTPGGLAFLLSEVSNTAFGFLTCTAEDIWIKRISLINSLILIFKKLGRNYYR